MNDEGREDVPRILATVMWTVPGLAIKTGVSYLRMRRDLQRSARVFYKSMVDSGMPVEQAQQLREKYENGLSTHGLMKSLGITLPGGSSTRLGK